jgi:UDP-N-acetylglucosamine 2-epimerase (non-hydrolysing)
VFFQDLSIRQPNYTLSTGVSSQNHYEQLAYLSVELPRLLQREKLQPEIILFLGDSNSALVSAPLFKEGYRIGHIEGGMRSYDRRMPEEVNRVICDYVSDLVFVYTPLYKQRLMLENKPEAAIFVVGNTILEVVRKFMPAGPRTRDYIVADIHRNENLKTPQQLRHILVYLNALGEALQRPVRLIKFNRAVRIIEQHHLLDGLPRVRLDGPYGFLNYLNLQYHARCVVSDSGTAQEECPIFGVPVMVPRCFTERPESVENGNSILIGETKPIEEMVEASLRFLDTYSISDQRLAWLGRGDTAATIVAILKEKL